jgi:hypothetical protein
MARRDAAPADRAPRDTASLDHVSTPEHAERFAEALAALEAATGASTVLLIEVEEAIAALELLVGDGHGG